MKRRADIEWLDANAWIGSWPFDLRPHQTARDLVARNRQAGIDAALVSPLDAILAPDPAPANRVLLETTRNIRTLLPLPIINPRLAVWREQLDTVCSDRRVRAVRVAPTWHGFTLRSPAMRDLAEELHARRMRLVITIRLEDERQQFARLAVRGLKPREVAAFADRHPEIPFLCTGFYRPEILALAESGNVLADLAMAEWDQTIRGLLRSLPDTRLCYGSLTPFLSIAANVAKVAEARVPKTSRRRIAAKNLHRFLSP